MKWKLAWMAILAAAVLVLGGRAVASHPAPAGEVARIQAHLETVERELLARDVGHLSAAQRAARARHVRVLREYREAGVFPHNHDFPGERVPYFVDEHGTLCAMAYLVSRSGRPDLVERVAATRNNAYVPELAEDAELAAWLREAGLSLEEAARIQPTYNCCGLGHQEGVSTGQAVASAVASAMGGVSIGMNLLPESRSRWTGILGLTAGAAGLAVGLYGLADGDVPPAIVGAATAGAGALSAGLGAWTLFRLAGDRPAHASAGSPAAAAPSVSVAPRLSADPREGVGVVLRVKF
jgi:hypothetical protein